jgi:hypothetical protein
MKISEKMPSLNIFSALIPKKNQGLLVTYLRWIKLLAVRGLHLKYTSTKSFNLLYRAVSHHWSKKRILGFLQQEFIKENLSLSLLLEPLDGFEWLSKNRYPLIFSSSSPILLQIMTPFARFVSVLNHQHPPFYQPFANLVSAYMSLYILSKPEMKTLLLRAGVDFDEQKITADLPLLHQEAKRVLPVINGNIFRLKIAFYLGLCRVMIKNNEKNIQKLNFLSYVNAFLYGLWYIVTTRNKAIRSNKI